MKKLTVFLFLLSAVLNQSFGQDSTEKPIYDYAETQHEFSLDILPIIIGQYPSSLLYRKHYQTKNGKNAALRFGLHLNSQFQTMESDAAQINVTNTRGNGIALTVGKEWQKNFTPKNMGYYGVDLGVGFSESRNEQNFESTGSVNIQDNNYFNFSSTGFIGMKHHFSRNFSVSAESGVSAGFNQNYQNNHSKNQGRTVEDKRTTQSFHLSLIPIRALRFAFHF